MIIAERSMRHMSLAMEDSKSWKGGLDYAKKTVSEVTGLDVHYAQSIDFRASRRS